MRTEALLQWSYSLVQFFCLALVLMMEKRYLRRKAVNNLLQEDINFFNGKSD